MFIIYVYYLCFLFMFMFKYSETFHFADTTNMHQSHSLLETLAKRMNLDLKNLSKWHKVNKLSLNVTKTELIIFQSKRLIIALNLF